MSGCLTVAKMPMRIALAALLALAVSVLAGTQGLAYADDTVDAGNGWTLSYSAAESGVTITGVSQAGSGELAIPSAVDGAPVVAFANDAFKGSGVTAVTIPSSVEGVSPGCFRDCTSLANVSFENGKTGYLGVYAFAGCTSLTTFVVPVLDAPSIDYGGKKESYRIGSNCFLNCTNLEKLEFLSDGGSTSGYFTTYSVPVMESDSFGNCDKLRTFVFYCERSQFNRWLDTPEGTSWYYTVDFYASKEDAGDYSKKAASVTCLAETPLVSILDGTVDTASVYSSTGEIPALPEGKMWGVSDHGRQADDWGLYNSVSVYPVDADDLDYAWVTSPEIKTLTDQGWQDVYWDYERAVFTMDKAGKSVPGVGGIIVHSADGSVLDPSLYTVELEARIMGAGGIYTDDYESVSSISSPGLYRVRAVASPASKHAGSATDYVEMKVVAYSLSQASFATGADAVFSTAAAHAATSAYSVVAPSSSWQHAMIGAGLAAAGNGVLVDSGTDAVPSASLRSIRANGADSALVLGAGAELSQSVVSQIQGQPLFANGGSVTPLAASSVQDLAVQAYDNIVKYGASRFAHEAAWGTSAVVMSPNQCFNVASVAEYVFAKKAPVFFTNADGSLPSAVANSLKSGGFDTVVVAGPARLVPDATLQQISASGASVTRLLASENGSGDANRGFVDACASELGLDASKAVVASMADVFNVILGAQVAYDNGAVLYTCASTEDAKMIQERLDDAGALTVKLVGSFDAVDPQMPNRVSSVATATPMSTAIGTGDTFEQDALLYTFAGSNSASLSYIFDKSASSFTVPDSVAHNSSNYAVSSLDGAALKGYSALANLTVAAKAITSIPASAFAGMANLKSVSYAGAVSSIGKSAFEGCSGLTSLSASVWNAASIGDSAFAGCKGLASASLTSKQLASIPANAFANCSGLQSVACNASALSVGNSAFAGCSGLKSVSLGSVTGIGRNAFAGCAALKSVSASSVASIGDSAFEGCTALSSLSSGVWGATSLGDSAFAGCKALAKVSLTSKKLSSIPKNAFANCTKLKSVKVSSKKLKAIGAGAFSGCKKLKTIVLKTTKLKKGKVGKAAFKGIAKKAKVKVPKKKVKAYKKIFKAKGLPKKAKVVAA